MAAKLLTLLNNVSYAAAAAGANIACTVSPFTWGHNALLLVAFGAAAAGAGVLKLQQSDDSGATWADTVVINGVTAGVVLQEVTLHSTMRGNVTTAGSAGTCSMYLIGIT